MVTSKIRFAVVPVIIVLLLVATAVKPIVAGDTANNSSKIFSVYAGIGGSRYEMGKINGDYINDFAIPSQILNEDISGGLGGTFGVGIRLSRRLTAHVELFLAGGESNMTTGDGYRTDESGTITGNDLMSTELTARVIAPQIGFSYAVYRTAGFTAGVGSELLYGFGTARLNSHSEFLVTDYSGTSVLRFSDNYEYTASGLGGGVYGTLGLHIAGPLNLAARLGYRWLETDDLENNDGDKWSVDGKGSTNYMNLDFSGAYIQSFIVINL